MGKERRGRGKRHGDGLSTRDTPVGDEEPILIPVDGDVLKTKQ